MHASKVLAMVLLVTAVVGCATPECLYVMDRGHNAALDESRWTPGVNVGKLINLPDNCPNR